MENQGSLKNATCLQLPIMALCLFLSFAAPAADIVPFSDITANQAATLIREKGTDPLFKILDVRTLQEFAESRIQGALNIDIKAPDFKDRIAKLDKNGIYLVYCKKGVRSARAMNLMKEAGFKMVFNLAGGLMKWLEEKLPLEFAPILADPPLG